jgi:cell division protein FtsW
MIGNLRSKVGSARVVRVSGRYLETPYASLQLLLAAGLGLLFFGLIMSASTTVSAALHTTDGAIWSQLTKEGMFLALSVPIFWLAVRMPPHVYRRLAYPALFLAFLSLVAVLIPHIGATINGAHRWIRLGPLTIQPSEFAKVAILLWGADLLARKEQFKTLTTLRHVLVPLVPGFIGFIGLVMLEPDLGTSLCFFLLLLGLLWMVGLPLRYFGAAAGTVAGLVTLLAVTEPYRMERLTTFMHPFADQQGSGFHTVQGLYALSSGGIFGVGLGQGTSKFGWVPNANTDYVFAIVGEELGLLGCMVVLGLFAMFTYSAIRIALRSNDAFVRYVSSGAAVWIAGQALINIGYVTALLPVTGIPLPFISNGGTSLILTCGVLGMLVSFARHEPAAIRAAQRAEKKGTTARWIKVLRLGTPQMPPKPERRPRPARATATGSAARSHATSAGPRAKAAPGAAAASAAKPRPARTAASGSMRSDRAGLRPTGTDSGRRR